MTADPTYNAKVYAKQGGDVEVVASGGQITVESGGIISIESGGTINDPAGVSLQQEVLTFVIADATAEATYWLVSPHAGAITKIWTVTDGAVATADITITAKIGATGVTNGVVTIATAASAAGDVDVATPTAANVVTAGQAINFVVTGGGAGGTPRVTVSVVITR
jgi:hypothetical protein